MLQTAYQYKNDTTEYIGTITVQQDPKRAGQWLMPACTTFLVPPTVGEHQVACCDGTAWETKADYRNIKFYKKSDQSVMIITAIGVEPTEEYTTLAPVSDEQVWDGSKWDYPLSWYKTQKNNELKGVRDTKDYLPVTTTLGSFDFDSISQERIRNAITITTGTRNWTLADGTTIQVTATDLQNVITAGAERSDTLHNTYLSLKAQVAAATTVAEVEAIVWP